MGLARGLAWAGIIGCCFFAFLLRSGFAWAPFAVVGVLCLAFLIYAGRREKHADRALPASLERLAYRTDGTSVTFAWLWRRGQKQRLRILRSDTRCARRPDDHTGDQLCVFDQVDDRFVDDGLRPRHNYHYSLFVEDDAGAWSDPILQNVVTLPQADQAELEELKDALGKPGSVSAGPIHYGPFGGGMVVDEVAGLATDAIFAVADIFVRDKPADGWHEVS